MNNKKVNIYISIFIIFVFWLFLFGNVGQLFAIDRSQYLIVIDPGHGGADPGAIGPTGYYEKDANLSISLKLKNKLTSAGYRVVLTRNSDESKSLEDRVNFINSSGADLAISIHNNAWVLPTANGTETYWSTSNNGNSSLAANYIHSSLVSSINRRDRGVKTADFYILKNSKIPAILTECVFISNPDEENLLKSGSFQDNIVDGIYTGVDKYFTSISNTNNVIMYVDFPRPDSTISGTYTIIGYALDRNSTSGTGIDEVKVYLDGPMESGTLLGNAGFYDRPDVAEYYKNNNLVNCGFKLAWDTSSVSKGSHTLYIYAHNPDVGWKYSARKVNVGGITIDNSTNIIGKATATEGQLLSLFVNRNSAQIDRARRLAPLYIKWGNTFNIRYDIAWAMMCHETGFLQFGGIVPPDANNFCGLGATGAKDENGNYIYNSFATEELGVIAQYIHLAWYIYPDHLTLKDSEGDLYCSTKYDPRHFGTGHNYNGNSTLGTLNGRWAPSPDYTYKIVQFANEIYN